MIWFGTDYGPGDPLRWSPVAIEIILEDWIPRKLVADTAYLSKAPELLRAFVRFCHAERGIRAELDPRHARRGRSLRTRTTSARSGRRGRRARWRSWRRWAPIDPDVPWPMDDLDVDDDGSTPRSTTATIGAFMRELLLAAAGGEDALRSLDDRPLPDEDFDWSGIPDDIHDKVGEVLALTDACCDELLDVEHRTACRRLLARAAAGDPVVFRRRASSANAAAAICWIVGKDNDLFSPAGGRMLVKDLMAHFGLAQGSVSQRADDADEGRGVRPVPAGVGTCDWATPSCSSPGGGAT